MYNGIGLPTARGSGTNGYVQRNWAFVRKTKDKVHYKTEEDLEKLEATSNRQPNRDILDHERKRKLEVKCVELEEILEDQGYSKGEIDSKVAAYRVMLVDNEGCKIATLPRDEFGRISVRETHQIAEAQQEKNAKLREAFGISEYFVEGSSLDPQRHAKEAQAKAAAEQTRKYPLVRTPSPEQLEPDTTKSASEKAKKRKKRARESSSSPENKRERKKKKSKKHKKDRSESPKHTKKKTISKEKKKEKERNKRHRSSSSDSSSDSSEESDSSSNSGSAKGKTHKKKGKIKHSRRKTEKLDNVVKDKRSRSEKKRGRSGSKRRRESSSDIATDSSPERKRMKTNTSDKVSYNKHEPKCSQSPPSRSKHHGGHEVTKEKSSKSSCESSVGKLNGRKEKYDEKEQKSSEDRKAKRGKEKESESGKRKDRRSLSSGNGRRSRSPNEKKIEQSQGKEVNRRYASPHTKTRRSRSSSLHRYEKRSLSRSPNKNQRNKVSSKAPPAVDIPNRSRSPVASYSKNYDWGSHKHKSPRRTEMRHKSPSNTRSPSVNIHSKRRNMRSESQSPPPLKKAHHSRSHSRSPHKLHRSVGTTNILRSTSPKRNQSHKSISPVVKRHASRTKSKSPAHKKSHRNVKASVSPKQNPSYQSLSPSRKKHVSRTKSRSPLCRLSHRNTKSSASPKHGPSRSDSRSGDKGFRDRRRFSKSPAYGRQDRLRGGKSPSRRSQERDRRVDSSSPKRERVDIPKRASTHERRDRNRSESSASSSVRSNVSRSPTGKNSNNMRVKSTSKKRSSLVKNPEKSAKKNGKSRSRSRSHSRNCRPALVMPRVRLRSSSGEEEDVVDEKVNREKEKEDEKEIQTLKLLQTGLAEKAKESLGKKLSKLSPDYLPIKKDDRLLVFRERDEKVLSNIYSETGMYFDINLPDREASKDIQKSLEENHASPASNSSAIHRSPDNPSPIQPALIPKPPGSPPSRIPNSKKKDIQVEESLVDSDLGRIQKKVKSLETTKRRRHSVSSSRSRSRSPGHSSKGSPKSHKSRSSSRSTYSKSSSRRSAKSYSSGSSSRSRSRSASGSHSRSRSRSRSHSRSQSRSRSRSASSGSTTSDSNSTASRKSASPASSHSSRSRSPSIPRRRGSPSFLDRRRITSMKKDGKFLVSPTSPLDRLKSSKSGDLKPTHQH